jgi:hypothetical protein
MNREELRKCMALMADDLQIAGDVQFRSYCVALDRATAAGMLTRKHVAHMKRLLTQADKLIGKLQTFWRAHPDLEQLVDRGEGGP